MNLDEVMTSAREAITVRGVFAEPYEKDGTTVIAAATISGGGGGGGGHDDHGSVGGGGGFGLNARPAGAYVIRAGKVTWRPAVDLNRLIATIGVVVVASLFTRTRLERARLKAAAHAR